MHEKERQIKNLMTMKAIQDNLMGPGGKFGIIAKYLGSKIHSHNGSNFSQSYMDDPWDMQEEGPYQYDSSTIHDSDDLGDPHVVGWIFDGLSRGLHVEIRYLDYAKELTVSYKGYTVFQEVNGELECYAPDSDWEEPLDRLFLAASHIKQSRDKRRFEEQKVEAKAGALRFLDKLRLKWGV